MKRLLFCLLALGAVFLTNSGLHSQESNKVLLFIRDGSWDLEFTLKYEFAVMKEMMEQKGFTVVVATVSGEPLSTDSVQVTPNLKLSDVEVANYSGFILPCMHAGAFSTTFVTPQAITMVKEATSAGKPIAAQHGSVITLVRAGVLQGKQYAFHAELNVNDFPEIKGSVYKGTGVVQDGNIITSGVCPFMMRSDNTEQLIRSLIDAINAKTK